MSSIGKDVRVAGEYLRDGKLVAIPTETVYGLAANALSSEAVASVFAVKNRPSFDPLIVHVNSLEAAQAYVQHIPDKAWQLAHTFWPGPLTLLLEKKSIIPDLVTSGLPTVGIRVPAHAMTQKLLASLDFPLAAPSANPFGYISPTTARHVQDQLGESIPYILDGGTCQVGIESTIISFQGNHPTILRLGGTRVEAIEAVVGEVNTVLHSSSQPQAPGMLKSHYAPRKPLYLFRAEKLISTAMNPEIAYLFFEKPADPAWLGTNVTYLSEKGDFKEAAQNLFSKLRELDVSIFKEIWVEQLPEQDLGRAINDRLRRAASKL